MIVVIVAHLYLIGDTIEDSLPRPGFWAFLSWSVALAAALRCWAVSRLHCRTVTSMVFPVSWAERIRSTAGGTTIELPNLEAEVRLAEFRDAIAAVLGTVPRDVIDATRHLPDDLPVKIRLLRRQDGDPSPEPDEPHLERGVCAECGEIRPLAPGVGSCLACALDALTGPQRA